MIAVFKKARLSGSVQAPPSKSAAHRLLLCAALASGKSVIKGPELSDDIEATLECLSALGADVIKSEYGVSVDGKNFLRSGNVRLCARESGTTLRFMIPLAWCRGGETVFEMSGRLSKRPLGVYEELAAKNGFLFEKGESLKTAGTLKSGIYNIRGDVSSQFVSGLLFALSCTHGESEVRVSEPFESRPYVDMTVCALRLFGADIKASGNVFSVCGGRERFSPRDITVEGDWSNAAFLDIYSFLGGSVSVTGLDDNSLQGDRIYKKYFMAISGGTPELDVSDCPDLAPVLMALAAAKNGARLTGTRRLSAKESDRGAVMAQELSKFGVKVSVSENSVTVDAAPLKAPKEPLCGHNDHRVVMSLSSLLTLTGGAVYGAEAVRKSFPSYFEKIKSLGAKVEIENDNRR